MTTYKAKKGNLEFYIQPDMIEAYSIAGYEIFKTEEVAVKNIEKELKQINELKNSERIEVGINESY